MKNIWFVNEYDLPPRFSKFRRRYDTCKYLLKTGKYNLHVICGTFMHGTGNKFLNDNPKRQEIDCDGVKVHALRGISYSNNIKRIISMFIFAIQVAFFQFKKDEKPDLIYASSPHLLAALGAMILAKREKVNFVLELRDLWPETWVQMGIIKKSGIIHRFFLALEKYLYINADTIVNLDPMSDYIINLGIDEKKIRFVGNGVDLETFDKKEKLVIPLPKETFNITYTGAIGYANNLDVVLDLAKTINNKNIVLNIIGYGPFKEKLLKRVQNEKITNIIFYDPVEKKDIPEILRASDVLIFGVLDIPLYKNGASFNKLFEYFASAKPILFYGDVNPDYIIEAKGGISVKSGKIEDLTDACLKLYNMSEEERTSIGQNGRKYVTENFDWKYLATKVDKIIEENLKD